MKHKSGGLAVVSCAAQIGGGEMCLKRVLKTLREQGVSYTLFVPEAAAWRSEGEVRVFPELGRDGGGGPARFFGAALRMSRIVRKSNCRLIYGNTYVSAKWAALLRVLTGVPAVCHLHESTYAPYASRVARWSGRVMSHYLAISEHVKQQFCLGAGVPDHKVTVIWNGVSPSEYTAADRVAIRRTIRETHGVPEHAALVLMVGQTRFIKGHDVLLEACLKLFGKYPALHLMYVGIERETEEQRAVLQGLEARLENNPYADRVRFVDYNETPRRFMRAADLLVVPSRSEGFGLVAIEGMAEGVPVIASDTGGLREIIVHGESGLLVPPDDLRSLCAALDDLLEKPKRAEQLAEHAGERYRACFTESRATARIAEVLTGIAG